MTGTASSDPFTYGLNYLYQMRSLAPQPDLLAMIHTLDQYESYCIWIGQHIEQINAELFTCLQSCHDCFHPWQQRSIQVFAAPFTETCGLDGICNLQTQPLTILVDVGQVMPQDWLALVAHEYAHAHLGYPGHDAEFGRVLIHLCRGLDLHLARPPAQLPTTEAEWRCFPPYRRTEARLKFWRGQVAIKLSADPISKGHLHEGM
jgi:hypothetical protein